MVTFVCSLLGLSFSGLPEYQQALIIAISGVVIVCFLDIIIRMLVSPVLYLFSGRKDK